MIRSFIRIMLLAWLSVLALSVVLIFDTTTTAKRTRPGSFKGSATTQK